MNNTALAGLALLGVAAAGCADKNAAPPVAIPSVADSSTTAAPTSRAPSPVPAGLCHGDHDSARVVAVYRALLTAPGPGIEPLGKPSRLYVAKRWLNGSFPENGVTSGDISKGVQDCLTEGVSGLPPISMVSGIDDPVIEKDSSTPIPAIVGGGKYVTFGDVAPNGINVICYVTVDAGGGDVSGNKARLHVEGETATSLQVLQSWIS